MPSQQFSVSMRGRGRRRLLFGVWPVVIKGCAKAMLVAALRDRGSAAGGNAAKNATGKSQVALQASVPGHWYYKALQKGPVRSIVEESNQPANPLAASLPQITRSHTDCASHQHCIALLGRQTEGWQPDFRSDNWASKATIDVTVQPMHYQRRRQV